MFRLIFFIAAASLGTALFFLGYPQLGAGLHMLWMWVAIATGDGEPS
ncbi:MAG: hypothetical protein N4A53_00740 [Pelagimonas sp.]|jgi:hypothetical protein|nr:hypothetical protein [Pelagimonas sp.]